jgi:uncharacterized protein (DUF302 family)
VRAASSTEVIVVRKSRYTYTETIARLSRAIEGAGNTIFITIDQSAAAVAAGLTLRPTSLIVFGNPKGGTPLMEAFPLVALELPIKVLIWEDDGVVSVAYTPASEIAQRYGIPGADPRIAAMDRTLGALGDSIA